MSTEYFEGFGSDVYIPSVSLNAEGEQVMKYTWVSQELADEAVKKGYMSAPETKETEDSI